MRGGAFIGRARIGLFLVVIVPLTLALIPVQWLALRLRSPFAARLPMVYHRIAARLIGLKIRVSGQALAKGPRLFLSNHSSWLDIIALGSVMPLSFVARADVADWPVFGLFAKLQRTVFVDRTRKMATKQARDTLAGRLQQNEAIVLFAEGTTSDGNRVLPFRSALLGAVFGSLEGGEIALQPVAMAYRRRAGLPLMRHERPAIAWYGDMDLLPHFGGVLKGGLIEVEICFGPPLSGDQKADRKAATLHAERQIRRAAALLHRGRDRPDWR